MVRKDDLKWSDLFAIGNLITITISMYFFKVGKTLVDFGINETENKKSGTQGHWYIIPTEYRNRLTNLGKRMRDLVDDYAIPFPLVEHGRFIPDQSVNPLLEDMQELKTEYYNVVDEIVEKYDYLRTVQESEIVDEITKVSGDKCNQDLIENTLNRINSRIPSASKLRSKFDVKHNLFAFQAPINQEVAETLENESDTVSNVIGELINSVKQPLIEKINALLTLVNKEDIKSFNGKSIKPALKLCDKFDRRNVFNDPFIRNAISKLRMILNDAESYYLENKQFDEIRLGLTELKTEIENKDDKQLKKSVTTNLGKRKLL